MTTALDIAQFLEVELKGSNIKDLEPSSITSAQPGSLVFLSHNNQEMINSVNSLSDIVCITSEEITPNLKCTVIIHHDPRLAFCKVLNAFFNKSLPKGIHPNAVIADNAIIGHGVSIESGTLVESNVQIGDNCYIGANVVIREQTIIGSNCIIKSNTTLGEPGFGFAMDGDGLPVRFPHLGYVKLHDHVEIGSNCTVARAALDVTELHDYVKTDDHVHIAHNCSVGNHTKIAAGAVLSGSVVVGSNVWISPGTIIIDYCNIGDDAFIGIGSIVTKPVPPGDKVFGNPAISIKKKKS